MIIKQYDVQCPHCNGVFFETNGNFDETIPANGSMFTAKKMIVDAGWSFMPLYDSTEYADVVCPSCDGQLLDSSGKVLRMTEIGEIDLRTPDEIANEAIDKLMAEHEPEIDTLSSIYGATNLGAVSVSVAESNVKVSHVQEILDASVQNEEAEKVACPACGKMYKQAGLHVHMAAIHPEYRAE